MTKTLVFLSAVLLAMSASCSDNANTEMTMNENQTLEVLKTRRAIRSYEERIPEKELLDKVLEAGTYAPTGMGAQSP